MALDPKGVAWISWDSYHAGNYDVFLRSFDGNKLGNVVAITTEPTAQFHSSVAVDDAGRVWVAWDDGGINWGKDFSAVSSAPGSRGLHYSRTLGVRVYANGRVQEPVGRYRQDSHRPHDALRRTAASGHRCERRAVDGLPPLDLPSRTRSIIFMPPG